MNTGDWLGFTCLMCICSYTALGELMCLSCRGVPRTTDCGVVEKCGSHSECFIDMIVTTAGAIYFDLGCRDVLQCGGAGRRRDTGLNIQLFPAPDVLGQTGLEVNQMSPNNITSSLREHSELLRHTYERGLQRRTSLTTCSLCCSYKNFCNDNGCGQTGFTQMRGPICYACDQQKDKNDCRQIRICGRDEICFIEEINLNIDIIYHTDCMSKIKCQDNTIIMAKSPGVVAVGRRSGSSNSPKGCCHNDLCNTVIPQNGNWGPWTTWSSCSTSCGYNGNRHRTRKCEFPPPNYGGLPCVGGATETDDTCANKSCDKGMVCLNCPASVSPRTCNFVETCGPNSVCYVEEYVTRVGEIRFKTGCKDKLQCQHGIRKTKRFMVNGDFLSCAECCIGSLCNSHGCGETGYPNLRGPVCYNCDQQLDPQHCNKINVCQDGQKCGLIRHQFVDTVYQTMCLDKKSCKSDDSSNNDFPKCCSTTLCTFKNVTNVNGAVTPTKPTPTTSQSSKPTVTNGVTTARSTKPTVTNGFTTAPSTKPTVTRGFTTAPSTKPTVTRKFTTASSTKPTVTHRFTTAPSTNPTVTHRFTTAPSTKPTVTRKFTTASSTKPTVTHRFTTAPSTKPTVTREFTTDPSTKQTVTTTLINQIVGHWSEWSGWSQCLEINQGVTGTRERTRHCYNPAHVQPHTCEHGYMEKDRQYCDGGGTDVCTPAQITAIELKGAWEFRGLVLLSCVVTGNPKPDVVWLTHTDKSDNSVQHYKGDPAQIIIGPIEERHKGSYVCEASNKCSKVVMKTYTVPPF